MFRKKIYVKGTPKTRNVMLMAVAQEDLRTIKARRTLSPFADLIYFVEKIIPTHNIKTKATNKKYKSLSHALKQTSWHQWASNANKCAHVWTSKFDLWLFYDFRKTDKHSGHCYSYFCGAAPLLLTKSADIRVDKMVELRKGLAAG